MLDRSLNYRQDPATDVSHRHDPKYLGRVLSAMVNNVFRKSKLLTVHFSENFRPLLVCTTKQKCGPGKSLRCCLVSAFQACLTYVCLTLNALIRGIQSQSYVVGCYAEHFGGL